MNSKSVVIVNHFNAGSVGNYIKRYTSREGATESLSLNNYVVEYAARRSATEKLKGNFAHDDEEQSADQRIIGKNGVAFGNHGISYTNDQLMTAAEKSQHAADQGHTPLLTIVSFSHGYLVEKGIVPKNMPEPLVRGGYRGQIDQLKLRQAITGMMDKFTQDYHYDQPEWTGCIQVDTLHVHCHLTTIETGTMAPENLQRVRRFETIKTPQLQLERGVSKADLIGAQKITAPDGRVQYFDSKTRAQLASQKKDHRGRLLYNNDRRPMINASGEQFYDYVENGIIKPSERIAMINRLDRELSFTRHLEPLVADITNARTQTKELSQELVLSNRKLARKMQALQAALPENHKLWRARSHNKLMKRPNEIANSLVNDLWQGYGDQININHFNQVSDTYATTRQNGESLSDDQTDELRQYARGRLREETINLMYRSIAKLPQHNQIDVPISVKPTTLSDGELKDRIAQDFVAGKTTEAGQFSAVEYRQRAYYQRYSQALNDKYHFGQNLSDFDKLKVQGQTSRDSEAARKYYQLYFDDASERFDKYRYLLHPKQKDVSKQRFNEVKHTDLADLAYDSGPTGNRHVAQSGIRRFIDHAKQKIKVIKDFTKFLRDTGQLKKVPELEQRKQAADRDMQVGVMMQATGELPKPMRISGVTDRFPKAQTMTDSIAFTRQTLAQTAQLTRQFEDRFSDELKRVRTRDLPRLPIYQAKKHIVPVDEADRLTQLAEQRSQWQRQQQQWFREQQMLEQIRLWREQQTKRVKLKQRAKKSVNQRRLKSVPVVSERFPATYFKEPEVTTPSGLAKVSQGSTIDPNSDSRSLS